MRRLLIVTLLALPTIAFAATPAPVTGLIAQVRGGNILVQWNAASDTANVVHYRVYYSRTSILENGGNYDDVEETTDSQPQYLLAIPPATQTLYIAVLAVNADGQAGKVFTEEIEVVVSGTDASGEDTPAGAAPSSAASTDELLEILSARAISATGVLVTFSDPLAYTAEEAQFLFRIDDGDGKNLVIRRLEVRGKEILFHTFPQVPGRVYGISVSKDLRGRSSSSGLSIAINPNKNVVLFQGFTPASAMLPPAPAPAPSPTPAPQPKPTQPSKLPPPPAKKPPLVVTKKPGGKDLAKAGPGALAVMVVSGGLGGFWRVRRRRAVDS